MKNKFFQESFSFAIFFVSISQEVTRQFLRLLKTTMRLLVKRRFIVGMLLCTLNVECKKEISLTESLLPGNNRIYSPGKSIIDNSSPYLINQCIYSYKQLMGELKTNTILIKSVVLNDGTIINTGNNIISMTYKAYDVNESYSLFRSEFKVLYNLYGYEQENLTNCWSLGCVYTDAGIPPFTCILTGKKVLLINTSFIWNLPGKMGKLIKYIVL